MASAQCFCNDGDVKITYPNHPLIPFKSICKARMTDLFTRRSTICLSLVRDTVSMLLKKAVFIF